MKYTFNKLKSLFDCSALVFCMGATFFGSQTFAAGTDLTLSGTFGSQTIASGHISTLTYTLTNSSASPATDIGFLASLPASQTIAEQVGITTSCTDGNFSTIAGGTSFTANNYRLAAGASCSFSFNITGTASGATLVTGLTSSLGSGADSSTTLNVDATLFTVDVSLSSPTISVGAINTINYSFSNSGSLTVGGASINLPAGLTIAPVANFTSDCSGAVVNEPAGDDSITISNVTLNSETSCIASIDILADAAGIFDLIWNDSTVTYPSFITVGSVGVSFEVQREFVNLNFSPITVVPSSNTGSLDVTLTNFDRTYSATDITFTDDLDAALSGLVATGLPLNDVCGSGSSLTGTSVVTLSGASLSTEGSCSFSIPVSIPANAAQGTYSNTATNISATINGSTVNYSDFTNALVVSNAPSLSISVVEPFLTAGDTVTLRHVLTNLDTVNPASAIGFVTDISGIDGIISTTVPAGGSCGGSSAFAALNPSGGYPTITDIQIANADLAAGDSCTFDVVLTLPTSLAAGSYNISAGTISSTINSQSIASGSPSANVAVTVDTAPALTFSFAESTVLPGSAAVIDFSLTHDFASSASATDISFTLDLDAVLTGLVAVDLPSTDICGSGASINGTGLLTFSGGTLAGNETCEFSVSVLLPADTIGGVTFTSSEVSAQVSGNSVSNSINSADLSISGLSFSKAFITNPIRVGATGTEVDINYLITNEAGADDATAILFTDSYSSMVAGTTITSVDQSAFCGASSATSGFGGSLLIVSNVEVANGQQCILTVTINLPNSATSGSYGANTSSLSATVDGNNVAVSPAVASLVINELSVVTSVDVSSPTSEATVNMSINFSDDVTGFEESDITVINASLANFNGSGSSYSVEVTPTADGEVTLQVLAGVAVDTLDASVTNQAAIDIVFDYQSTPLVPTPSLSISVPSTVLANSGPVIYTVSYLDVEQVNLTASDITLNKTGSANADVTIINGDMSTATVSLDNLTGEGSLGITIAEGSARFSTNLAPSAGPSNIVVVDAVVPNVVISGPTGNQTSSFVVNIDFDENMSGFTVDDIVASNGTLSDFQTINAASYTVQVDVTGETSVSIDIAAGVATDSAGNGNTQSNTYTTSYDDVQPSVMISGPSGVVATVFTASFNFSESVTGFTIADITVTNASLSNFVIIDAANYSVLVSPTAQANVSVDIVAGVAADLFGNSNLAASYSVIYDFNDAPMISGAALTSINEDTLYSFSPVFSDADVNDTLVFNITNKPLWASFSSTDGTLSGTPTNDDVGSTSDIVISVSDGALSASLTAFNLEVINTNDAPVFESSPVLEVIAGTLYSYALSASDIDPTYNISFELLSGPEWLSINSEFALQGIAPEESAGEQFSIVVALNDGDVESPVLQEYLLTVVEPSATELSSRFYFTPAPATAQQEVSLVLELTNLGLTAAEDVIFEIAISDELSINTVPAACSESESNKLACQLDVEIESGGAITTLVALSVGEVESGFTSADVSISGGNLGGVVIEESAQLLLANVLSVLPGDSVISTPSSVGFTIDINDDSFADLLSFDAMTMKTSILTNDGNGQLVMSSSLDMIQDVKSMLVADVNGDGALDLLTAGGSDADSVAYLLNGEQELSSYVVMDAVSADFILVADLLNDTAVEVVLAGLSQADVAIYSGFGTDTQDSLSITVSNLFNLLQPNALVASTQNGPELKENDSNKTSVSATNLSLDTAVTSLSVVQSSEGVRLLATGDVSAPILVNLGDWTTDTVRAITTPVEKMQLVDVNGDDIADAFIYNDMGWSLIISVFETDAMASDVQFPDAEDIVVSDLNNDGVSEILFIMPQGVSIWHYYGLNDIRVDVAAIVTDELGQLALMDVDNDGDLDIVTFDGQKGVSLWYMNLVGGFGEQEIDLTVFAQAPNFPQVDQAGPISFSILNQSSGDATDVRLVITPSSGVSLSQLARGCSAEGDKVVCVVGGLAAGEGAELTVWVSANSAGEYSVDGLVSATQFDVNEENDKVTVMLNIPEPASSSSDAGATSIMCTIWLLMLLAYRRRQFS